MKIMQSDSNKIDNRLNMFSLIVALDKLQSTKINEGSRKILERRGNSSTGSGGNECVSIDCSAKEQRDISCRQSLSTFDKKPQQEAKTEESDRAARPTSSKSRQSLLMGAKGAEDSPSAKRSLVSGKEPGHQQAKQKDLVARLKAAEQEVVALRDVCLQALVPNDGQRQNVGLESLPECQRMSKDELLQLAGRIFWLSYIFTSFMSYHIFLKCLVHYNVIYGIFCLQPSTPKI